VTVNFFTFQCPRSLCDNFLGLDQYGTHNLLKQFHNFGLVTTKRNEWESPDLLRVIYERNDCSYFTDELIITKCDTKANLRANHAVEVGIVLAESVHMHKY